MGDSQEKVSNLRVAYNSDLNDILIEKGKSEYRPLKGQYIKYTC